MMAPLIVLLADSPNLEVHVFGPDGGGSDSSRGSQSADKPGGEDGTDLIIATMQSAVHKWHQVRHAIIPLLLSW